METAKQLEKEIGRRLARLRLSRNETQAHLANRAGIGVRTLRRLEIGEPSTLDTFLRVASALKLAEGVLSSLPDGTIRPIERSSGRTERKRARPRSSSSEETQWTWGDESE